MAFKDGRFQVDDKTKQERQQKAAGQKPTFFQDFLGTGTYKAEENKIRWEERKATARQEEAIKKKIDQDISNDYNRPLRRMEEKLYGNRGYGVEGYERQARLLEKAGHIQEAARVRHQAAAARRQAEQRYDRFKRHYKARQIKSLRRQRRERIEERLEQFRSLADSRRQGTQKGIMHHLFGQAKSKYRPVRGVGSHFFGRSR